ncbi:DUF7507 domain-containing protein, partial [Flavobacterium gawalongense]|uniref:DUF7507 domain-containing protein n=1 Tax=Flavobacterium gawalongense TaxID=2594432 RepID=UPI00117B0614
DITYTNSNGCQKTVTVTVNALPTISGTLSVCVNSTTQLTGSATAAASNPWVSSDPSKATVSSTGLVTGVSAGTADITYTNSNGCQKTVTVTVNALPAAPVSGGNITECKNPSIQTLTATATVPAGQHIDWYNAATAGEIVVSPTLNTVGTVTYYAQAVNNTTSCISLTRTAVTLTINACSIVITKDGTYQDTTAPIGTANPGDTVTYAFVVTNTGNVTLTNVSITDLFGGVTITGGPITLAVDASNDAAFHGTYTITQADIDAGFVYNLAKVSGTPPTGPDVTSTSTDPTPCTTCPKDPECTGCTITPIPQTPDIAIVKTNNIDPGPNGCAILKVGDLVTYTFTVTNEGNVSLHTITVLDPHTGLSPIALQSGDSNNNSILEVPETWIYTATYTVTQTDIDNGNITNQASVKGTAPDNTTIVTDKSGDSATEDGENVIPICTTPDIAIVKTNDIIVGPNGCAILKVGDVVTYTFTVTNEGNVSLHDVAVEDLHTGLSAIAQQSGDVNDNSILEVTETWIYTATYTVTQTDIDNGNITNQASVKGTAPDNTTIITDKSGDSATEDGENVIPICTTPDIAIVKTNDIIVGPNGCAILKVGDVVTYTFTVTNEGNVSLHDVAVEDLHTDLSAITLQSGDVNNISILEVGETWIYTATYTVTQTDIDAGTITNQASVNGTAPDTTIVTDKSGDSATEDGENVIPICTTPNIAIVKTNDIIVGPNGCAILKVGDVVTYTFTVTNEGNVSLHDVTVEDLHTDLSAITLQSGDVNNISILEVGETWIYTATYTVTQTDIDNGNITNQASVKGTAPDNTTIVTDKSGDSATEDGENVIPICINPDIALVKTNDIIVGPNGCAILKVGDVVTYTFTVTNEGNVSLHDVAVEDLHTDLSAITLQSGDVNNISILEVGETWIYTATYTVTQTDIDAGTITNQASVKGTAPDNTTIVNDLSGDSATEDGNNVIPICTNPDIALVKTGTFVDTNNDGFAQVGEKINYTFAVTNTGNVIITNIVITDLVPLVGFAITGSPIASLAPGATNSSVTGVYTVTQADINAGQVTNSALAIGKDPKGEDVRDISGTTVENDTPTVTPLNNIITITSACTSSTETRNLNDYLPAGTPTDGIWTDVSGTGQLAGSIVSPFGLAITSENNPYAFTYQIGEGTNFGNIRLLMSVDNECFVAPCRTIIVHNAFSPNGDGINEVFIIENITDTCYIDNTVEIYNRWGVLVFDTRNYDNESNYFDGISRGRTTISQSSGLPTGTYYYILNYTSVDGFGNIQTNKKDGYLYLTR